MIATNEFKTICTIMLIDFILFVFLQPILHRQICVHDLCRPISIKYHSVIVDALNVAQFLLDDDGDHFFPIENK